MNEAVADLGERLFSDRYLLVRIEDIALIDPAPKLRSLIKFLELPVPSSQLPSVITAISAHVQGKYAKAYGGNKHGSEEVQARLIKRLQPGLVSSIHDVPLNHDEYGGDIVLHALQRFGYNTNKWGLRQVLEIET